MPERQILALPVSVQRDVSALHGKRAALKQEIDEINVRLLILGRTVIGGAGFDVDELLAAGWDLDLPNASVGVVMTPPPAKAESPAEQPSGPVLVVDPIEQAG